jgi:hypothetical protein
MSLSVPSTNNALFWSFALDVGSVATNNDEDDDDEDDGAVLGLTTTKADADDNAVHVNVKTSFLFDSIILLRWRCTVVIFSNIVSLRLLMLLFLFVVVAVVLVFGVRFTCLFRSRDHIQEMACTEVLQ